MSVSLDDMTRFFLLTKFLTPYCGPRNQQWDSRPLGLKVRHIHAVIVDMAGFIQVVDFALKEAKTLVNAHTWTLQYFKGSDSLVVYIYIYYTI